MGASAEVAEASASSFIHPLTEEVIGFSENSTPIERLRLICDPAALRTLNRNAFIAMFPPTMDLKERFNPDSTQPQAETMLTYEEKRIRTKILEFDFGYTTPKKATAQDEAFLPHLHVAFTPNANSFVRKFNRAPEVQKLKDVYQTSLDHRGNRYSHTQHLMHWAVLDVLRPALHQPQEFLEKYELDMRTYEDKYRQWHNGEEVHFSLEPSKDQLDDMIERFKNAYPMGVEGMSLEERARIACIGVNEAKLVLINAGEHDSETPGFCDLFMKARGSGILQGDENGFYSEDDELASTIWSKLHDTGSYLASFAQEEGLDIRLLATMIRSTASENDTCLPGLLFKDKRKNLANDPERAHLAQGQVLDLDQLSGTLTNLEIMSNEYLPGGFNPHITQDEQPKFSFDTRLMILYYAMLGNVDKEKLGNALSAVGINPKDIYISAEEISYGQNTKLERVRFGDKVEIMPIPILPGDVKRTYAAIVAMYTGFYVHPSKETMVEFFKNMITSWVYQDEDRAFDFVHRTKSETLNVLQRLNPLMFYFENFDQRKAAVLSEDEMQQEITGGDDTKFFLSKRTKIYSPVPDKTGTQVRNEKGEVVTAWELLRKRRGSSDINPHSLPERVDKLSAVYKEEVFMRIELTQDDVSIIVHALANMRKDLREKMISALRVWTQPIVTNSGTTPNPLYDLFISATYD